MNQRRLECAIAKYLRPPIVRFSITLWLCLIQNVAFALNRQSEGLDQRSKEANSDSDGHTNTRGRIVGTHEVPIFAAGEGGRSAAPRVFTMLR